MVTIKFHSTAVFVKDIEVSKKFYTKVLGQEVAFDFGRNVILKCGITLWAVDPEHIIPEKLAVKQVVDTQAKCFELYFETDEIEVVFRKISEKGIEKLEHFVRRLHLEGRTPEQVAEKTSIPLNEVRDWIYR